MPQQVLVTEFEGIVSFTKRTCVDCGWRGPQPQMVQRQRRIEVARSRSTVSGSTVFGALLGDKKSKRRVVDSLFNNNQRTYTRAVTSWYCRSCAGVSAEPAELGPIGTAFSATFVCLALLGAKLIMLPIMSEESIRHPIRRGA